MHVRTVGMMDEVPGPGPGLSRRAASSPGFGGQGCRPGQRRGDTAVESRGVRGQLLSIPDTNTMALWGAWLSKGGDHAVMTYEILSSIGSSNVFDIEVWTKAREDRSSEGTKISTGSFAQYGSTNFYTATIDDFEELFRIKIVFEATDGGSLIYRMLEPTWFNKAGTNS